MMIDNSAEFAGRTINRVQVWRDQRNKLWIMLILDGVAYLPGQAPIQPTATKEPCAMCTDGPSTIEDFNAGD